MLVKSGFQNLKQPALELSKRPALVLVAQGASPSMRERRINGYYDALFGDKLQGGGNLIVRKENVLSNLCNDDLHRLLRPRQRNSHLVDTFHRFESIAKLNILTVAARFDSQDLTRCNRRA